MREQTTTTSADDGHLRQLRLRRLVHRWAWVGVVVGLIVAGAGGWLIVSATTAEPTTETETVGSLEYTAGFEHEATVEEPNAVFPVGTTVEAQPIYYTTITPTLDSRYVVEYTTVGLTDQTVTVTLEQVIQATSDDVVLWEDRTAVTTVTTEAQTGEAVATASVDVPNLTAEATAIEDSLGAAAGETEFFIEATVEATGTVDDQTGRSATTDTMTIDPDASTFTIEAGDPVSEQVAITEDRTVEPELSVGQLFGGVVFLLGGILVGGFVGGVRLRGAFELTEQETAWLRYHRDRDEFEEWITTITRSEPIRDGYDGTAASLSDLVDYAIDTDNAVVYDPTHGRYLVAADQARYVYDPPEPPAAWSLRDALVRETTPSPEEGPQEERTAEADE